MEELNYNLEEIDDLFSPTQVEKDLRNFVTYSNSSERLELFYASALLDKYWRETEERNSLYGRCACGTPRPKEIPHTDCISDFDPEYPLNRYTCHCKIPLKQKYQI